MEELLRAREVGQHVCSNGLRDVGGQERLHFRHGHRKSLCVVQAIHRCRQHTTRHARGIVMWLARSVHHGCGCAACGRDGPHRLHHGKGGGTGAETRDVAWRNHDGVVATGGLQGEEHKGRVVAFKGGCGVEEAGHGEQPPRAVRAWLQQHMGHDAAVHNAACAQAILVIAGRVRHAWNAARKQPPHKLCQHRQRRATGMGQWYGFGLCSCVVACAASFLLYLLRVALFLLFLLLRAALFLLESILHLTVTIVLVAVLTRRLGQRKVHQASIGAAVFACRRTQQRRQPCLATEQGRPRKVGAAKGT